MGGSGKINQNLWDAGEQNNQNDSLGQLPLYLSPCLCPQLVLLCLTPQHLLVLNKKNQQNHCIINLSTPTYDKEA